MPEVGSPFAVSASETTLEEQDDSAKMPPIDNSELCVQEPSSSKKLPSLTNEGRWPSPCCAVSSPCHDARWTDTKKQSVDRERSLCAAA